MPRMVDHEERRAEVAAAVWRVVSSEGLDAVTVRRVAAETGMSTSVVSHYFAGKDELLRLAFRLVVDRGRARAEAEARVAGGGRARALLATGLPLDAARRTEARIWFSFLGLALTRPDLAADQRAAYRAWRGAVAAALRVEGLRAGLDAEAEAAALIALVDGLAVQAAFEPRRLPPARQLALLDERLAALGVD
ncbi:MAG TPA: TetR family transcriptional regulator C-terminal domain-containing protein [Solirubrobacteraceae bacterium]|nr:TetR family transcriptional regulator C-terminal domain-containing protein [Solirubrobacteraceae bacterium]